MTDPKEKPTNEKEFMTEEEIMEYLIEQFDASRSVYFDTRTLTPPLAGRADVCPVASCKAALRRRQIGKRVQLLCPEHGIEVRTKSFVYDDPVRNIRFEQDYFEDAILKNRQISKAETHRLGNENSEDALS